MPKNLTHKILDSHLMEGKLVPGEEIGIRIDHTLLQDATGTLAMLEFEALGLDAVRAELAVQYVDHNILQTDNKNADDHRFLQTACARFGIHFSPPGNGVSHQVHMERFGVPGKTMLGADSHTPGGSALSMLAVGMIVGSPLLSYASNRIFKARKPVLIISSLITVALSFSAICSKLRAGRPMAHLPWPAISRRFWRCSDVPWLPWRPAAWYGNPLSIDSTRRWVYETEADRGFD